MNSIPKPRRTPRKSTNYLSNANLLREIAASRVKGEMTPELVNMLIMLVDRYARKPNWRGYSYLDEMKADSIAHLCAIWWKFNENKSDNPFSFYTTCVLNIFRRRLKIEQKHGEIRDKLYIQHGLNPSFKAQISEE